MAAAGDGSAARRRDVPRARKSNDAQEVTCVRSVVVWRALWGPEAGEKREDGKCGRYWRGLARWSCGVVGITRPERARAVGSKTDMYFMLQASSTPCAWGFRCNHDNLFSRPSTFQLSRLHSRSFFRFRYPKCIKKYTINTPPSSTTPPSTAATNAIPTA